MNDIFKRGRCVGSGRHDLFFSELPEELAAAQAICSRCEVRLPCLELALDQNAEFGVWGGVIFWQGLPYHRKRGRGRPRNDDRGQPLAASWEELEELVSA